MRRYCILATAILAAGGVAAQQPEPQPQTPRQPLTRDFESLDKDGDGHITRAEAEHENVEYHFDAIDKDKDEALSREEFVRYIAEEDPLLGEPIPTEELPQAELRERLDQDPDVVTNPELLPKIDSPFEDVDEDGNRYITREESDGEELHEHFSHMDTDNDGRISISEYNNYLYKYGTQVATQELMEETGASR
ncbi:EF-hand domain-containing protein [Gilvimarinus sp. F26214L]|uniref:EF-hand domain-containing protein n=1 Tax=Gilvimarinus sp. DZF01 TaxID=3461371 RepID=UPI004045EC62